MELKEDKERNNSRRNRGEVRSVRGIREENCQIRKKEKMEKKIIIIWIMGNKNKATVIRVSKD
jgi:hypothetical protein